MQAGFDMDLYLDWRRDGHPNGYNLLLRNTDTPMEHEGDSSYFNADSGASIASFLTEYLPDELSSDADVLLHAVSDALLGAAGLGDIGRHFPDTDPKYKGADSLLLLKNVAEKVAAAGYQVSNIDVTMIAQRPKLKDFIPQMEANIALAVGIAASRVNVKATTEERLGFTGTGEGMACHAVCLLEE